MVHIKYYEITLGVLCLLLVEASSLEQICGKRKTVNQLIVNGAESKDGDWPWHAAIFHNDGLSFAYACGGTILDQNLVLTAAHCVMTSNGIIARERLVVQVGRNRLRVGSNRVQEHETFQLIVHPEYNINSIRNDIALIKLATDITYTDYVQPICLWNRGEELYEIVGMKGTVVGFGRDETGRISDTLREASIPVVSHITCIESNRNAFALQLTSDMFCAGNRDGIGACNGDSGGGMFFKYDDVWYIRGVVSFTKPHQDALICDPKEYTVFSDVAKYLKWIEQHMRGSGQQSAVTKMKNNDKIGLLPMSTCGPNPYAIREELSKPVLSGYPWMGLVECKEAKWTGIVCQATLISDLYLISTAQCVKYVNPGFKECSESFVRLGDYDLNTTTDCAQLDEQTICSPPVQIIRIESCITHPSFGTSRRNRNISSDIGLIRLQDRADTSQSNVKPICLPVTNELRSQKSTFYIQTSWIFNNLGKLRPLLHRSLREMSEPTECEKAYKTINITISSCDLCTKLNEEACDNGFAAAPLQLVQQVQGENRYVLHGIFSIAQSNCRKPDIFTGVACHIDWVLENILE